MIPSFQIYFTFYRRIEFSDIFFNVHIYFHYNSKTDGWTIACERFLKLILIKSRLCEVALFYFLVELNSFFTSRRFSSITFLVCRRVKRRCEGNSMLRNCREYSSVRSLNDENVAKDSVSLTEAAIFRPVKKMLIEIQNLII